jgi:hypothetical protein
MIDHLPGGWEQAFDFFVGPLSRLTCEVSARVAVAASAMRLAMRSFEQRCPLIPTEAIIALSINIAVAIFGYYLMMIILRG